MVNSSLIRPVVPGYLQSQTQVLLSRSGTMKKRHRSGWASAAIVTDPQRAADATENLQLQ